MEMEFLRKLPTPSEIKEEFPLHTEIERIKSLRIYLRERMTGSC